MDLENNKFLVVGLGKTGIETSKFLYEQGADFKATDAQPLDKLSGEVKTLLDKDVNIKAGLEDEKLFNWADIIVLSPGVSFNNPHIKKALNNGKTVISEIELAFGFIKKPIIAITGTNGKTTTTTLLSKILENADNKVFTGGNIGTPLISIAGKDVEFDLILLELSSFQLQGIMNFKPYIAAFLNISDNHLDHHKDFKEYMDSKFKIFKSQTEKDFAVINIDDKIISEKASGIKAQKIGFGKKENSADVYCDSQKVFLNSSVINIENRKLIGNHNIENICAAVAICNILGINNKIIEKTVNGFAPLPHRIEYISTFNGVKIYNDSKSTSPDATLRAIESLPSPIILIAGGKDKSVDYTVLSSAVSSKVKNMVLIGEVKERMKTQLENQTPVCTADTLKEAVNKALLCSAPDDTLLFSPACSSFDMFSSYQQRGEEFKKIVKNL